MRFIKTWWPLFALAGLIVRTCWWTEYPSILPCLVFWMLMLPLFAHPKTPLSARALGILGVCLNAIATISNNGYMPVVGGRSYSSIWVPWTDEQQMFWLVDHMTLFGGSVGDLLLLGHMALCVVLPTNRKEERACVDN